jgi:tetratricopeptide (TPR) repeat protein
MMKPLDALAKARPLLERAMELDSTLVEAHCTLGLLKSWYELDWDGAERAFEAALGFDPNHITALVWRSIYLSAFGRHQESIASVQRALECEPLSPVVNAYLGMARANAGQYDLGIRQLNQAIELDPHYYRAYLFLGNALQALDRNAEAISAFEKALSINPHNLEALAYMGSALASAGDRDKAIEILEKLEKAEERFEPSVLIASIYASLGDMDEMLRYLQLAYERKSSPIYIVQVLWCFRRHQSDPRYRAFVASLGLPLADSV